MAKKTKVLLQTCSKLIPRKAKQGMVKFFEKTNFRREEKRDKKRRDCSRSTMKPAEPLGNIALLPLELLSCQETVKTISFQ